MSARDIFVCPGCREALRHVAVPPEGDAVGMPCPAPECRRPIFVRCDPDGLQLCTTQVPDLGSARYVLDQSRILDHGQELVAMLSGAPETLVGLCEALNTDLPADHDIAGFVRTFIQQTGGTFAPGPGLIRSGLLARQRKESSDD